MPRKTDSTNPADWLWLAASDLAGVRLNVAHEVAYYGAQAKLAEVLEKILKAELIQLGWPLESSPRTTPMSTVPTSSAQDQPLAAL